MRLCPVLKFFTKPTQKKKNKINKNRQIRT